MRKEKERINSGQLRKLFISSDNKKINIELNS